MTRKKVHGFVGSPFGAAGQCKTLPPEQRAAIEKLAVRRKPATHPAHHCKRGSKHRGTGPFPRLSGPF